MKIRKRTPAIAAALVAVAIAAAGCSSSGSSSSAGGGSSSGSSGGTVDFYSSLPLQEASTSQTDPLVNGIKLQGTIESFDQFVVLLRNTVSQMVYKHAISTVVPARNVRIGPGVDGEDEAGDEAP